MEAIKNFFHRIIKIFTRASKPIIKRQVSKKNYQTEERRQSNGTGKYFYILGSYDFLVRSQELDEILMEKLDYYNKNNFEVDWTVIQKPSFMYNIDIVNKINKNELIIDVELKEVEFKNFLNKIKIKDPQNYVAVISEDELFIRFLKLRLNQVELGSFIGPTSSYPFPESSLSILKIVNNNLFWKK